MKLSAHFRSQLIRAARIFVITFASSGVLTGGHLTTSAIAAAIVAAAEVTVRQVWPTTRV